MDKLQEVRVRVAPSPTGDPHVGTAYVALFNYVFAQKNKGKFVLRIEDTDQVRAKTSSEQMIEESLDWLGIVADESPTKGGKFGPYRQSERLHIYREHVDILVNSGAAYHCFCDSDRLEQLRESQKKSGQRTGYDRYCRSVDPSEASLRVKNGETHVVRLKMPESGKIYVNDLLRGRIEIDALQSDDQVLLKSDGFPTYHLANVVDDHLMKISHVIRAEEWISSTPKHVILYQAFGWTEPVWVHLPLLRNENKSKISKRKNPVSLNYYRRAGILPDALVNFLALMGWSFGNDREVFSLEEMIAIFDLKKISLGDPIFDMKKLTWMNQQYLHRMNAEEFADHLLREVFTRPYLSKLHGVALERLSKFEDFVDNNAFFFNGALEYNDLSGLPKKIAAQDIHKMLKGLVEELDELYTWQSQHIDQVLESYRQRIEWKPKDYFMTLRTVITGRKDSPPLGTSIELIGREMVRFRLRDYVKRSISS